MMTAPTELASVRYLVDDVPAAVDFYTTHLGFTVAFDTPVFSDVRRGPLRLLLSGPASSGARATPDDATTAGRNLIELFQLDWVRRWSARRVTMSRATGHARGGALHLPDQLVAIVATEQLEVLLGEGAPLRFSHRVPVPDGAHHQ